MAHANILISDGHTGSVVGLWPPDAPSDTEGGRHVLNPIQQYIWECQQHALTVWLPQMTGTMPRMALFHGDMVDGLQPKSPIITDDGNLQVNAAVMAWRDLAGTCEDRRAVTGTEFHAGKSGTWDNAVALGLQCTPDDAGRWAPAQTFVQIDNVIFDMAHHLGGSYVVASRYTPLQREYTDAAVSVYEGDWPRAQWIVRGHGHFYRWLPADGCNVLALPGWQAKTPHAHKMRRGRPFDIGLVVVYTDAGRTWPPEVKKYAWPMPKVYALGSPLPGSQPQSTSNGCTCGSKPPTGTGNTSG